jgi:tetratricopeptide (TPR) repeat protein
MKRLFLIFVVTLCVLTACNSNRDRLIEINGYLNENRLDTAQLCLNMVSPDDLSEYDKALYDLITVKLNHLSYKPVPSDTLIRSCIDVFTRMDDKERLAESMYYQAVTDYEKGHVPQAFTAMKKAETIAEGIDDLTIRHKIIESLTDWNMTEHQYQLAMSYGRRNLELSTMANNNNWIAYALVFISQIHTGMGQSDSARHYLDKCIPYMEDVPDSQRVDFYNYIAILTMKTDLPTAHSYAMKGNAIRPNSLGYVTLAQIRYQEGASNAVIDSLCDKAYELASNQDERTFVLEQVIGLYEKQKRYDKAARARLRQKNRF